MHEQLILLYAQGNDKAARLLTDSVLKLGGDGRRRTGVPWAMPLALLDGRLGAYATLSAENWHNFAPLPDDELFNLLIETAIKGPSPSIVARLDTAIAKIPFRELPMIDRPYLEAATALALAGRAEKARGMIARYHAEMTDTSIIRAQNAVLQATQAEIALAAGNPREALAEFRLADVGYDGAPANECAPCLSFNLGRAYDAAGKADSATMMFERYLATPYWRKPVDFDLDPVRVPAIRERLGQLYEGLGRTDKAVENYRAFIDLWKNADPELQPRVADARRRLAKLLTPVEKPRP